VDSSHDDTGGLKMPKETGKPNERMQAWIDARKRHGLSHAEVQMARELGMNPENWVSWTITSKRHGRFRCVSLSSISPSSDLGKNDANKKELRREARLLRRQSDSTQREEIP